MTDIKRITPGSKADLARRMADRRRELIARPLAEIWEELAAVALDGSGDAPSSWSRDSLAQIVASDGLKARASYIQGFTYEPSNGEPYHVIRDVWREPGEQELFRTNDREQYEHRIQIEKAAIIADAILAACPSRSAAMTDRAYPAEMTAELREVLSTMCFQCIPFAQSFRAAGIDIPHKAESEQAHVLHWMIGLVLKHGAEWRTAAVVEINELRSRALARNDR